jgi:hypothetical protein
VSDDWIDVEGEPGMSVKLRQDERSGRQIICGLHIERAAVTAEMLRRIPLGRIEAVANLGNAEKLAEELPPLVRQGDPAAFSALVARHYRAWARLTPHPAARMAAAAGANPRTVHTWIREARLRGLLPSGARGKAG